MTDINKDITNARQIICSFVKETSSLSTQKTCLDILATYAALLDYDEKLRYISEEVSDCEDADDISVFEIAVREITEGIQRIIK